MNNFLICMSAWATGYCAAILIGEEYLFFGYVLCLVSPIVFAYLLRRRKKDEDRN